MIRISYVMKKVTIDSSNISKFLIDQKNRRNIRDGKVKELVAQLQRGEHFSAPFVVNERDDRWNLIDGNHRYEAIKTYLASNSASSPAIDVWMAVYRDLDTSQEREVFTLWNKGTTQSATDFLKAHWETVSLGKEMLRKLPVTIYGDKQHLPIKNLVGCQIDAKEFRKFDGSYSAGKEQTVADFQQVTPSDIDIVETFCDFMKNCFGRFDKNNKQFYQTTPLSVFYRIWFDNKHISMTSMESLFRKVFTKNPQSWEQFTKSGGRSASKTFYGVALAVLRKAKPSQHIRDDQEVLDEHEKQLSIIKAVKNK